MAKIVLSESAPSEAVHFVFGTAEFDLGGRKKSYETNDADLLSNAAAHPWLSVERDPVELLSGAYVDQLAPADDHLSLLGQDVNPNDPDAVQAAEESKASDAGTLTGIDAGKDQSDPVVTGGIAETLAADDSDAGKDK